MTGRRKGVAKKRTQRVQFVEEQINGTISVDESELGNFLDQDLEDLMAIDPTKVVDRLDDLAETFMRVDPNSVPSELVEIHHTSPHHTRVKIKLSEEDIDEILIRKTNPLISQAVEGAQASYSFKIPEHIKENLARDPGVTNNISKLGKEEPIVGVVVYIGSPVNGEMLVANPGVVNDWLTYARAAKSRGLIKIENGLLAAEELQKLNNLVILPEGRHRFNISYDMHPDKSCANHCHSKYLWRSPTYPCAVMSCGCPNIAQ